MKSIIFAASLLIASVPLLAAPKGEGDSSSTFTGSISGEVTIRGMSKAESVVIYLKEVDAEFKPDTTKPTLDQLNREFVPHILPILVGTTVRIANSDSLDHNVFSPSKLKPFNIGTWGYGGYKDYVFDEVGVELMLCNIHHEMSAVILVLQNPYFTLTDEDGKYTIEGVPLGKYILKAYHEKLHEGSQEIEVKLGKISVVDFDLSL